MLVVVQCEGGVGGECVAVYRCNICSSPYLDQRAGAQGAHELQHQHVGLLLAFVEDLFVLLPLCVVGRRQPI